MGISFLQTPPWETITARLGLKLPYLQSYLYSVERLLSNQQNKVLVDIKHTVY